MSVLLPFCCFVVLLGVGGIYFKLSIIKFDDFFYLQILLIVMLCYLYEMVDIFC